MRGTAAHPEGAARGHRTVAVREAASRHGRGALRARHHSFRRLQAAGAALRAAAHGCRREAQRARMRRGSRARRGASQSRSARRRPAGPAARAGVGRRNGARAVRELRGPGRPGLQERSDFGGTGGGAGARGARVRCRAGRCGGHALQPAGADHRGSVRGEQPGGERPERADGGGDGCFIPARTCRRAGHRDAQGPGSALLHRPPCHAHSQVAPKGCFRARQLRSCQPEPRLAHHLQGRRGHRGWPGAASPWPLACADLPLRDLHASRTLGRGPGLPCAACPGVHVEALVARGACGRGDARGQD
mmetsp:Transcript_81798/g.265085  ORF Transcript_81798/g.265085 Transcript_81798/m.265085 type:complete len:304 (-) Transcript_81798:1220-2131(-)